MSEHRFLLCNKSSNSCSFFSLKISQETRSCFLCHTQTSHRGLATVLAMPAHSSQVHEQAINYSKYFKSKSSCNCTLPQIRGKIASFRILWAVQHTLSVRLFNVTCITTALYCAASELLTIWKLLSLPRNSLLL